MSQTVHAMQIDGRRVFRVWSNSTDEYVTGELDEDGLRSQFLLWAIEEAVRKELLQPFTPLAKIHFRNEVKKRTAWDSTLSSDEDDEALSSDEIDEVLSSDEDDEVLQQPAPTKPLSSKKAARLAEAAAEMQKLERDLAKSGHLAEVALKAIQAELAKTR